MDRLSGFIFLCNGKTKPECYMHRVFGLPEGKKDVIEKIEPGMKLFLFDFELKPLYGVYEATSFGKLNLQPAAFGGKFPAQVSFRICKDFYPLPECTFIQAIQENYQKGKFKQELNNQQVSSLLLLFQLLTLPTSVPVPPSLSSAARPLTLLPPAIKDLCWPQATLLSRKDPSAAGIQVSHNLSVLKPQHAPQAVEGQQYSYYGSSAFAHLSLCRKTLPAPTMPYLEDPYAFRMQRVHVPQVLETRRIQQCAFSSQCASYGAMVNTGYAHHAMELRTPQGPTASYNSADTQQAYAQGNPYYRYGPGPEVFPSNQHLCLANEDYHLSQRKQEMVLHPGNAFQNYSLYQATENAVQNHCVFLPTATHAV